ncbi:Chemotaxis phosphatase CheX [Desulfuromusa kysingii]|uniref:Chemotaxis phosphatase CheX n=1 Tax=Desulfuromusa kysingii TaxID=37625 RepID=A0A1H4CPT1_9BACT|nr:chemotaxis protein CheX [Desulfuromusa kysingii]SEA62367.1 Chemotaxis phosphatase CheX [Desulfuromusa kysingii]
MKEHDPFYLAMIKAASQTFENMAFMEVMEHFNPAYEIPADEVVWNSLQVNDPVQGEIRLAVAKTCLKTLTGTIFGIAEDEITSTQMNDILNELLNTIVGLFLTNLCADDQEYKMGLPALGEGELPEVDAQTVSWKLMSSEEDALHIFATGTSLVALNNH